MTNIYIIQFSCRWETKFLVQIPRPYLLEFDLSPEFKNLVPIPNSNQIQFYKFILLSCENLIKARGHLVIWQGKEAVKIKQVIEGWWWWLFVACPLAQEISPL